MNANVAARAARSVLLVVIVWLLFLAPAAAQQRGRGGGAAGVYKARISPHWFDGGSKFWYQNDLAGGKREFILVDAVEGKRERAFDHERLAAALKEAGEEAAAADRLALEAVEFKLGEHALEFRAGKDWRCDLSTYTLTELKDRQLPATETPSAAIASAQAGFNRLREAGQAFRTRGGRSPDGKWTASIKNHNVSLSRAGSDEETQLTKDGREGLAYDMLQWSPDSATLVAFRVEPGERKEVHFVETSPRSGGRAVLHSRPYALPGDKFTGYELNLFACGGCPRESNAGLIASTSARRDCAGRRTAASFTYEQVDRGHQRLRLIEVDALTGNAPQSDR